LHISRTSGHLVVNDIIKAGKVQEKNSVDGDPLIEAIHEVI
jgi:hypothetical protein